MLFNAGGVLATSSSNDKSDNLGEAHNMKQSFFSQKTGGDAEKKVKKHNDYKARGTQLKDSKMKALGKIKMSSE